MTEQDSQDLIQKYNMETNLAVGNGELPIEIDLSELANGLDVDDYDPENSIGLYYYPEKQQETDNNLPQFTFYRSGKYILRCNNKEELYEQQQAILDLFTELGVLSEEQLEEIEFDIVNVACMAVLNTEFKLSPLAVLLGFKYAEYEPEQFPSIIYDNDMYDCKFLIFATGKIILPGAESLQQAAESLDVFINEELDLML